MSGKTNLSRGFEMKNLVYASLLKLMTCSEQKLSPQRIQRAQRDSRKSWVFLCVLCALL
jgi:hypothetical protein